MPQRPPYGHPSFFFHRGFEFLIETDLRHRELEKFASGKFWLGCLGYVPHQCNDDYASMIFLQRPLQAWIRSDSCAHGYWACANCFVESLAFQMMSQFNLLLESASYGFGGNMHPGQNQNFPDANYSICRCRRSVSIRYLNPRWKKPLGWP